MQNSRNIGLEHGAGKGDKDRSNRKTFAERFPDSMTGTVDGFERRGGRLVKVYGPRGRGERVTHNAPQAADFAKVDADFASAQSFADAQNKLFREKGFDTQGH